MTATTTSTRRIIIVEVRRRASSSAAALRVKVTDDGHQIDAGPATAAQLEASAGKDTMTATTNPNWILSIDMRADLRDGADPTFIALRDLADWDTDPGTTAVIDGIEVTTDTADSLLDKWTLACEAAWIAQANQLGYAAHDWDPATNTESDARHNDAIAADLGWDADRAEQDIIESHMQVWDTVTLPEFSTVAR